MVKSEAQRWVERTCRAQGIPVKVGDLDAAERIAVLLGIGRLSAASGLPDRLDASGVEGVAASDSRLDNETVEENGGDGPLASGWEIGPLAS